MIKGKDNSLLVEFEFVVDLDIAMFKFIRENYYDSDMVNHDFLKVTNEAEIIYNMLYRSHINPLEYLIPGQDTTQLYWDLLNDPDNFKKLLSYARAYDTFALMITFLKEASSVSIDILCRNEIEADYIKSLNANLSTRIIPERMNVPLAEYTALYVKYFPYLTNYDTIEGKHIYIPAAKFNMEPGKDLVNARMVRYFGQANEIHLIDLYRRIKFRFKHHETDEESSSDNKEDLGQ